MAIAPVTYSASPLMAIASVTYLGPLSMHFFRDPLRFPLNGFYFCHLLRCPVNGCCYVSIYESFDHDLLRPPVWWLTCRTSLRGYPGMLMVLGAIERFVCGRDLAVGGRDKLGKLRPSASDNRLPSLLAELSARNTRS